MFSFVFLPFASPSCKFAVLRSFKGVISSSSADSMAQARRIRTLHSRSMKLRAIRYIVNQVADGFHFSTWAVPWQVFSILSSLRGIFSDRRSWSVASSLIECTYPHEGGFEHTRHVRSRALGCAGQRQLGILHQSETQCPPRHGVWWLLRVCGSGR